MTARKHHYVPQCYLKGFAKFRDKPKLYVVDAKERKAFRTAPAQVAAERDFHRIDVEGLAPDAFENSFSKFESELSLALGRIIESRSIKNENDRAYLFNLVAMMAIKNPRLRETFRSAREQTLKMALDLMTATPERWASVQRRAEASGDVEKNSDVTYEQMRDFSKRGEFTIQVPPMEHLRTELNIFDKILPCIFNRKWLLLKAPSKSTAFITSDHPACLLWSNPSQRGGFYPPGLGLPGTELIFPISNELAMIGSFELEDMEIDANQEAIAGINGAAIAYAERQIYARESDFVYAMKPNEKHNRGETLLQDKRFQGLRSPTAEPQKETK